MTSVTGGGPAAERRHCTVIFCDLVDFTRLAGSLDPEDLRDVLHVFRDAVRTAVGRHDGFIASYMGDGVLIFFGYPHAHEDDPQRAVRTGLEIVAAISELRPRPGVRLQARAGIATGLVVIGALFDEATWRDEAVVGQVANLAARLQTVVGPGGVLMSTATHNLVSAHFDCVKVGPLLLKGFDEPIEAWQPIRERTELAWSAGASRAQAGRSPLRGRDEELGVLLDRWRLAEGGRGQVVLLRGEPGIGKSRLSLALHAALEGRPHTLLLYICSERFQNVALSPVIRVIERASDIAAGDVVDAKLDKLEGFLAPNLPAADLTEAARSMAALLSIPFEHRYPRSIDSPERQKRNALTCLKAQLWSMAGEGPILAVFEDLHWADATTLELIGEISRELTDRGVLMVLTARQEFAPPWPMADGTVIELQRLDAEAAAGIVRYLATDQPLPPDVLREILAKSDGVPLFVEELTRSVLEVGRMRAAGGGHDDAPATTLTVPDTLRDSLMARLDRLAAIKEVAQTAAAIGRDFSRALLAAVMAVEDSELDTALNRLTDGGLVSRRHDDKASYGFKHALIHEAAYSTLLRGTRQRLHRRIAETIERQFAEIAAREPENLAHHWRQGNEPAKAIPYLQQAGQRAAARAALHEARSHFSAALELAGRLPDDTWRRRTELGLRLAFGLAASASRGYAAPEVQEAYQGALALCRELDQNAALFPILRGLATFYIVRSELDTARQLSQQCLSIGEASGDPAEIVEGCTSLGYTMVYQGDLTLGLAQLSRAVELYRLHGGESLDYGTPQDPAVASLSLQGIAAWLLGDWAVAEQHNEAALALADRLGHPFNVAYARCYAAMLENLRQNYPKASAHAAVAFQVSQQHGFDVWMGAAAMHRALADGMLAGPLEAAALLAHILSLWEAGGARLSIPFFLTGMAACQRAGGRIEEAEATITRALGSARAHGELFLESEILRLGAEISHDRDRHGPWRAQLGSAIARARSAGARSLELRAVRSLLDRIDPDHDSEAEALRDRLQILKTSLERSPPIADEASSSGEMKISG